MSAHPPKPRLALAVGIIGHRPNRLPEGARETVMTAVEAVLEGIVDAARTTPQKYSGIFADEPPLLSIVSALAEGADTNVAEAALARGFVLDAPLPFAVEIYQADFATEAARAAFRDLIGRARSVLTLPGQRAAEAYAYEAAGRTVLGQSDILLTVWDGGPSAGQGGTTEMLTFAARSGIPIIHVDAKGAAATCIRWSGLSEFPAPAHAIDDLHCADLTAALPVLVDELVRLLVDELVRPPAEKSVGPQKMRLWSRPDTERDWLNRHLRDRIHRLNLRLEFPALMALFQVRPLRKTDWQPPGPGTLAREYAQFDKSASERGRLNEQSILALAYGWADAIGVWFGQVFRSAFVTNFLLAAFAVLAAALSLIWTDPSKLDATALAELAHHKLPFVVLECTFIVAVLVNTAVGYWRGWHRRWFEGREIAERLRVALPLWVLGVRPATFFGEEPTWTGWYARAIVRAEGMRAAVLDEAGLNAARATLRAVLVDQCNYHKTAAARMETLETRLEWVGAIFFGLTLLAAGLFLAALFAHTRVTPWQAYLVTAVAAGLPALATATYGIRVIGDFGGVARRSERTHAALERVIKAVDQDPLDLELCVPGHGEPPMPCSATSQAGGWLPKAAAWLFRGDAHPHGSFSKPSPKPLRLKGMPMPSSGVWKMMKVAA